MLEKKNPSPKLKEKKVISMSYSKYDENESFTYHETDLCFDIPFKWEYISEYKLKDFYLFFEELEETGETLICIDFVFKDPCERINELYSKVLKKIKKIKVTKKYPYNYKTYSRTVVFSDIKRINKYREYSSNTFTRYVLEIFFDKEKGFNNFISSDTVEKESKLYNSLDLRCFIEYERAEEFR